MRRLFARSTQILIDTSALAVAFWLAFGVRFEWQIPEAMWLRAVLFWPYVVGFQFLFLAAFGVRRYAWRYVGLRETIRIFMALLASSIALLVLRFFAGFLTEAVPEASYAVIPTGVILIQFVLAFLAITGVRVGRRMVAEQRSTRKSNSGASNHLTTPTLLIGAGQAGVMVAKELASWPQLGLKPVGFLDDDPLKKGVVMHGIAVLGSTDRLTEIATQTGAKQALITIANTEGQNIRRITNLCRQAGLLVKIIPGIYEIVGGKVNLSRIRDVAIQDLLGREPVVLDESAIDDVVRNQVVLITGAGGSIGQELCRQVCRFEPRRLLLLDQAETSLFEIHGELSRRYAHLDLVPCIADICDGSRLAGIFKEHKPSSVFHAAAYKHVPMMEANPREAIKNNVIGTKTLADIALASQVQSFVMISTDKAVNPTSVMGATKRLAEIYIQSLSRRGKTLFVAVRFGNVLGSAGSVVPIFRRQIARGGPVTVTHPEMRRYFMTIEEACQLVLQAATMGDGGEIFILDMGEPMRIVDLARDLITLSGLKVGEDIEIEFSGTRPGEKLFEELSVATESAEKTHHPKIYVGKIRPEALEPLLAKLEHLESTIYLTSHPRELRAALLDIVPEYTPDEFSADDVCQPKRAAGG